MKTKLQRAVDATLEKYDELLERELRYRVTYKLGCGFCREYRSHRQDSCGDCPAHAVEPGILSNPTRLRCLPILRRISIMHGGGHAIPALLAAMCYLWGFVEE